MIVKKIDLCLKIILIFSFINIFLFLSMTNLVFAERSSFHCAFCYDYGECGSGACCCLGNCGCSANCSDCGCVYLDGAGVGWGGPCPGD